MHIIAYSTCWECKQIKEKLVCFDGLEKWQDNAEICLDCLVAAKQSVQRTADSGDQLPAEEVVKNYNKAVAKSFRRR